MSKSKTKKIVGVVSLVLCLALAATFVLAFAACDEESAEAGSVGWIEGTEFVSGGSYTIDEDGGKAFDELPETANSEVVEPVRIDNAAVTNVSDPDKNGVSTCTYEGGSYYLSPGGGVYDFYPYSCTLAPVSAPAKEPEIQVSGIFVEEPAKKGKYFNKMFNYLEVGSLTGEPLDITYISIQVMLDYKNVYDENGEFARLVAVDSSNRSPITPKELNSISIVSTDTVKVYEGLSSRNYYVVVNIELGNGDSYSYGFNQVGSAFDFLPDDDIEEEEEDIEGDEDIDEDILSTRISYPPSHSSLPFFGGKGA